jgi:hypothetical protein
MMYWNKVDMSPQKKDPLFGKFVFVDKKSTPPRTPGGSVIIDLPNSKKGDTISSIILKILLYSAIIISLSFLIYHFYSIYKIYWKEWVLGSLVGLFILLLILIIDKIGKYSQL